jgi:hypothetical protein
LSSHAPNTRSKGLPSRASGFEQSPTWKVTLLLKSAGQLLASPNGLLNHELRYVDSDGFSRTRIQEKLGPASKTAGEVKASETCDITKDSLDAWLLDGGCRESLHATVASGYSIVLIWHARVSRQSRQLWTDGEVWWMWTVSLRDLKSLRNLAYASEGTYQPLSTRGICLSKWHHCVT